MRVPRAQPELQARTAVPDPPLTGVRAWLLRPCSVSESAAIYAVAFFSSALLGLLRQILLNRHFGTGDEISAYYAAFRLPETLHLLLAGGTLANALIPVLLAVQVQAGEQATRRFINITATMLMSVVIPLIAVWILAAPFFVRTVLAPGFDPATSELTIALTRLLLLDLILAVLVGVAIGVLISRNQVILPALAVATQNVTLMLGIAAAMYVPGVGIWGPALGAVGDLVLQLLILLPGLWWQGIRLRPHWSPNDPHLRQVVRLLIPNGMSGAVNYAGAIVDTAAGSLARTAGSIAAQYNAVLLFGLPVRLFGVAIGQAALPRLAEYTAQEAWQPLRHSLRWAIAVALGLSLLTIGAIVLLARPAIRLVLERGAFSAAAGDLTYTLLLVYAVALPAAVITEILTRCLIALHDTLTPLMINLIQLAVRAALAFALLARFDIIAVALAFTLSAILETLLLGLALQRKLHRHMRADRKP